MNGQPHALPFAAVTLFEGGRVYGADVIAELVEELHASVALGEGFEGEMRSLVDYARWACGRGCGRVTAWLCYGELGRMILHVHAPMVVLRPSPLPITTTKISASSFQPPPPLQTHMPPPPPPNRSLALVLDCIRSCAGGRPIELLRKESLAGMPPPQARRRCRHCCCPRGGLAQAGSFAAPILRRSLVQSGGVVA
jgi:hypothetical protein